MRQTRNDGGTIRTAPKTGHPFSGKNFYLCFRQANTGTLPAYPVTLAPESGWHALLRRSEESPYFPTCIIHPNTRFTMQFETGAVFTDETFLGTAYPEAAFSGMEFENCRFVSCDFSGSRLASCLFDRCRFEQCNLSNLNVHDSVFRNVTFAKSKLMGIWWYEVRKRSSVLSVTFDDSLLTYCNFAGLDLRKCRFMRCHALEADFSEADLSRVSFSETNLGGAVFNGCNLTGTDFSTASHYYLNPAANKVKGARFGMPDALNLLQAMGIEIVP